MENPFHKWMMTGGTPISGNLHVCCHFFKPNELKICLQVPQIIVNLVISPNLLLAIVGVPRLVNCLAMTP